MPDTSDKDPGSRPPASGRFDPVRRPGAAELVARLQALAALLLGIFLVAVPLYLWRRPRAAAVVVRTEAAGPEAPSVLDAAPAGPAPDVVVPPPVSIADPRVLECHDRGARRTPPEQCDHLPAFEKVLADAIAATHACVPPDAGAGSIEFLADVSFGRKRNPVQLSAPRDGVSFPGGKIARDCLAQVRASVASFAVAPLPHQHARYRVSVLASYPARSVSGKTPDPLRRAGFSSEGSGAAPLEHPSGRGS